MALLEIYYPGRNHNLPVQRLKFVRRFELTPRKPIFKFQFNLSRSICIQLWLLNKLLSDSKAPQKPSGCLRDAVVHLTLCGNWNFVKIFPRLSLTDLDHNAYLPSRACVLCFSQTFTRRCMCLFDCPLCARSDANWA